MAVRKRSGVTPSSQEVQSLLTVQSLLAGQLLLVYAGSSCVFASADIIGPLGFMLLRRFVSAVSMCFHICRRWLPCRCHVTKIQCAVATQEGNRCPWLATILSFIIGLLSASKCCSFCSLHGREEERQHCQAASWIPISRGWYYSIRAFQYFATRVSHV